MKILYLLIVMVLGVPFMSVADSYRSVAINLTDGTTVEVNLTDDLTASFDRENMFVTGADADITVPKTQIKSFVFNKEASLATVGADSTAPRIDGGNLVFDTLPANSELAFYDAAGRLLSSRRASGRYVVAFSELPKGVVLLNVNGVTYKIAVK